MLSNKTVTHPGIDIVCGAKVRFSIKAQGKGLGFGQLEGLRKSPTRLMALNARGYIYTWGLSFHL